jgi:hypothetical protein
LFEKQTEDDALAIGFIGKEKRRYEPTEKAGEVFVPSPFKIQKGFGFKKESRNLIFDLANGCCFINPGVAITK